MALKKYIQECFRVIRKRGAIVSHRKRDAKYLIFSTFFLFLFIFFLKCFRIERLCSTSPPRGIQVDGLPRVVSIGNLRCLRGSVRKFLNITNMIWKHLKV